jgi:hypothetical protein
MFDDDPSCLSKHLDCYALFVSQALNQAPSGVTMMAKMRLTAEFGLMLCYTLMASKTQDA